MIYNKQFIVRFRPYAVGRLTRLCKAVASASDAGPGIAGGRPRCAAGLTPYRLKPAWTNRNPPLFLTISYLEDAGGLREKLAAPRRGGRVADMGRRQVRESSVGGERASGPPNALTNEARVRISQDVSEPSRDPAAFAELRCVKTPPLHLLAFQPAPRPSGARNSFC